jgi:hypothetical protein
MSETPKKIEFTMMKDSAAEFDIARMVAFKVSGLRIPLFLIMSTDGLMKFCVISWIPKNI